MRLDQFISQTLNISRKQAKALISKKSIQVNTQICSKSQQKIQPDDKITYQQKPLQWPSEVYWLLNKPANYCCSHIDDGYPSIFKLLPQNKQKLHIAGRLDADTTGLLLVSSDGQWCHTITSPKQKNTKLKVYAVTIASNLTEDDITTLENGILLHGETEKTLPAIIEKISDKNYLISISEGRYHQIKRMFAAVGNKVESLHRQQIANIILDGTLTSGNYRALTNQEIQSIKA